jgi:MFS family permease
MEAKTVNDQNASNTRWYQGISSYLWLVLIIASLGWIFDIFEGQIFIASDNEAMRSLLPKDSSSGTIAGYNYIAMAAYLVGGALGGVLFGALSDRVGRTRTMILTILVYSLFTCVTAFSQNAYQMIVLRFFVALGTGGEWAVASAMVAEVFPKKARAWSLGIFHASSVLGTYLAVLAGTFIVGNPNFGWRWAFVIGALPALLTLWIRWKLREPEQWIQARQKAKQDATQRTGRILDLFSPDLRRVTMIGLALATVGLATFWGVHVHGKQLLRRWAERPHLADLPDNADLDAKRAVLDGLADETKKSIKDSEMLGMFLVTTGGGLGLLSFGPISERIGRRGTFLLFHLGGLVSALVTFQLLAQSSFVVLCVALPIFGYLTLGMHAGYAIYFPELFPTRVRGTGGGFCFNGGRLLAASILFVAAWMRGDWGLGMTLESSVTILSLLFLLGLVFLIFAPETKGRDLPT